MFFDTEEFAAGQKVVCVSRDLYPPFDPRRIYTVKDTRTFHSGDFPAQGIRLAEVDWRSEDGTDLFFPSMHFKAAEP